MGAGYYRCGEIEENDKLLKMNWEVPYGGKGIVLTAKKREDLFLREPEITAYVKADGWDYRWTLEIEEAEFSLMIESPMFGFSKKETPGAVITPSRVQTRGSNQNNNLRTVFEFWGPGRGDKVRVGFTQHVYCGTWSSWPPHDFEIAELTSPVVLYPGFCEKFAYVFEREDQWGIQTQMKGHGNLEARVIRDKEIGSIDIGVHPLVAMPGARLSYFWAYANGGEKFEEEHS